MAKKRSAARPTRSSATSKRNPRGGRILLTIGKRLFVFARPRTTSQMAALAFLLIAIATAASLAARIVVDDVRPATWSYIWVGALVALAGGARLSPRWAPVQRYASPLPTDFATVLLLLVAGSISWEAIAGSSPLPGQTSSFPLNFAILAALTCLAIAVLLRLPAGRWVTAGAGSIGENASRATAAAQERVAAARERRVLEIQEVSALLAEAEGDEPGEPAVAASLPTNPPTDDPLAPADRGRRTLLPPIDLFVPPMKSPSTPIDLEHKSQRIRETLASFNVGARVVGHHCGPVVTQFDIEPDRGVKVRRITELQNDLALALAAPTIRIQAPVPGKPVIGIEIPNTSATTVTLRELLETEAYRSSDAPLRMALGKDVAGKTAIIDLARMPHLLIAGATGSGKSACINALISCLIYNNTPDQVRLMMVDPKMVELTVYNDVPHLLSPVVTEMDKVVGVLQWALREMERRYKLFASNGVRNIGRFNEKALAAKAHTLPYIVLIVDELADLMMVSPEDVEDAVCRLAQLARAAGIHLVIATQRPSVDVVTGLIKANFPARIAFAMTSQVDSRTILDRVGAEKLLGRGDMLYQPPDAPSPTRLQGAFLSDPEIERLVEFWKESPLQRASEHVPREEFEAAEKESAEVRDELMDEAIRVVREFQHASVSLLQRRLRVGYSRAARIMDQLEETGVVGPADGSKQRPVLGDARDSP